MTDNLRNTILEAALLRANGASWTDLGAKTKRSAETCRQWPRRYPDIWAAACGNVSPPPIRPAPSARMAATRRASEAERASPTPPPTPVSRVERAKPTPQPQPATRLPRYASDPIGAMIEHNLRTNPEAFRRHMARVAARQEIPAQPGPATPRANPLAPCKKPVVSPAMRAKHEPRAARINRANLTMGFITALSIGWALGCTFMLDGRSSEPRAKIVEPAGGADFAVCVLTNGNRECLRHDAISVLTLDRRLRKHYDFECLSFPTPKCDPTPRGLIPDWPPLIEYPGDDSSASHNRHFPLPVEALCSANA